MGKRVRRIVQFHHKGGEHLVSDGKDYYNDEGINRIISEGIMNWNCMEHRRKFMENHGRYIDSENKIKEGRIMMWGEWEGISEVSKIDYKNSKVEENMPNYIHKPKAIELKKYLATNLISKNEIANNWQNTDPYIFGDYFIYSNCQQAKGEATIMKSLEPGSVIVMGSSINSKFSVDTVFVVGEELCRYSRNNLTEIEKLLKAGDISQTFWNTTIVPLLRLHEKNKNSGVGCGVKENENVDEREYKLYKAATYDNPVYGMYSFFPCKPYEKGQGFKRVPVNHDNYINPKLTQKIQSKTGSSPWIVDKQAAYDFWSSIVRQVLEDKQNLCLGIWAKEPKLEK